MNDFDSSAFTSIYLDYTLLYRFGQNFSSKLEFKEKYEFPNALGLCHPYTYKITCFDNQVDVMDASATPDPSI